MDLLIFKLVATPLLLLAATLSIRRWGESIGGLLVGLPLTSGPVSVFLALEHGPSFAAQATSGSLAATAAQATFCLAYCRLSIVGWPFALAGACAAFSLTAILLKLSGFSPSGLFFIAMLAMTLTLRLIPEEAVSGSKIGMPWWDLPLRMGLITSLVIGVTLVAPYVGPMGSGVLAAFPFIATILAVFAHHVIGAAVARQILRGMVAGLLAFAVFFYVLGLMLETYDLLVAYSCAVFGALAVQAISWYRVRARVPAIKSQVVSLPSESV